MLDEKDEKILKLLRGNARMSYEELGREIGMTRVAAKKRVQKLAEAGIIRGYNTCIYREGEITAFMDITTTMEAFDDVLQYVSTNSAWARQIYRLAKENHILMVTVTKSSEDLRYLARTIAKQEGVVEIRLNAAAEVIKDVYGKIDKFRDLYKEQENGDSEQTIGEQQDRIGRQQD